MKHLTIIVLLCSFLPMATPCQAQEYPLSSTKGEGSFGMGVGLDYGTIGFRGSYNLANNFSIFLGLGYQFAGIGHNIGLQKDFKSKRATQFFLRAMHGSNAAIKINGLDEYNSTFVGTTVGGGIKVNSIKKTGNFWDFGLMVPFTNELYRLTRDTAANDPRVENFVKSWPVTLSVGYNWSLSQLKRSK
ncbi:MAG: hypothetical protein AAFO69_05185 [Bacteroidota bacterium]